ncbi:diphosphomevalonate decarboxylase [Thiomicrorhabdus sp. 6S2-11]|uniref:diphosphomevalonate decarboxylase n=1 Tax=Thiomicrorhabdus marina TaxID=2818442 RepID=A0ABS3Q5C3_9GAMM|nr:diphosphomevalonate decarboxylase [Thiomicrorhabdus marina]MBO1927174.1 diphosphomevalonate decarboxylase [Thiomicrorhabdus marina]
MNNDRQRQTQFIQQLLQASKNPQPLTPNSPQGLGSAPVNIALSKYWGKRDKVLNLPINGSVSISLPGLGTETVLKPLQTGQDKIVLNGEQLGADVTFAKRLSLFLDYFRSDACPAFTVETVNSVPTAAGLASSASGYAALVLALDDLFGWQLPKTDLSLLARFGSGSASRSLFDGFALWHRGEQEDGMDSFAEALDSHWPEFCIGLVKVDTKEKAVGSTVGMQQTVETCDLYKSWPEQAERNLQTISQAIIEQNFGTLGKTAEHNALSMHATMIATWPPIVYWQPESVAAMQIVWQLREQGTEVYFTMDAGPNLKLIMQAKDQDKVRNAFAEHGTQVDFILPFAE